MKGVVIKKKAYDNHSPWIHQLEKVRKPRDILKKDIKTDMAIVGAGIAGICTAYFILRDTKNKVVVVEANKVAHGATGHNAGQIVSYFEKPFSKIVEEYGLELAARGQEEILSGWELLEQVYSESEIKTYFSQFIGYAGCSTLKQLNSHLENKYLRNKANISIEKVFVSEKAPFLKEIPKKYDGLYELVPHKKVLEILETKSSLYHAALASKKGCLNSALFCEELISYLLYKYKDRISLYEFTPIDKVELYGDHVKLSTRKGKIINGKKVVLCTNGFQKLKINNKSGKNIDTSFHDFILGVVGYMAAYISPQTGTKSNAISYFPKSNNDASDAYFYLTKREFSDKMESGNLISVGGPEVTLDNTIEYIRDKPYFEKHEKKIDKFLKKNYIHAPKKINYKYHWHGLMGYTKSELRAIGPHPYNKNLLYNLGCNGVGILPSIYGGYKIARFITGIKMPKSIFDVGV
ncbi:FAD-binding oxidoreductase [Candidatus Pacearchaeota archaeon]|nr:FAD-binding oxidoreductase [Candidatus Pacearchaeota archaeon]